MPPRGRKPKALIAANDHPPSLELLEDSYHILKQFQQAVVEKARSSDPGVSGLPGRTTISTFNQLLEYFKTVMDHELEDSKATSELISQSRGLCGFFRYQLACLYSLPLKNIFVAIRSSAPISSSPMLGLVTYIYYIKLVDCQARFSDDSNPSLQKDASLMIQVWENVLAAFGDGIRLFMNSAEYGPKLNQFQVLVGKVFYPFLGNVLRSQNSNRTPTLSEHVKRSLLDAGEALSGGCAENKEFIRDSNVFGPAKLSYIISDHSDFITANIALQLAFAIAPPLKGAKAVGKNEKKYVEVTRTEWFEQIFTSGTFSTRLQDECVSRLTSMSSKQFWLDVGEIQAKIFEDDDSRAYALPIRSGTIEEKEIRLNSLIVPILQSTVQFNKSSITWCSLDLNPSKDSLKENQEVTAEICYDAILDTQLEGLSSSGAPLSDCKELNLLIDFKSDSSFEGFAPTICYAPLNGTHQATLALKLEPRHAATVLRVLKRRKIKFSCRGSHIEHRKSDQEDSTIAKISTNADLLEDGDNLCRENSKISIAKEAVCSLEAEAFPDLSQGLPVISNSRERVASVQRDASIHSSRGVGSSSVSMEKMRGKNPFSNNNVKSSVNKTVSSKVSGTDSDEVFVKRKVDQLKKPREKKSIIQSPQESATSTSLPDRPPENQPANVSSISKPPEPNPKKPSNQIPTLYNGLMRMPPDAIAAKTCSLSSERGQEKNENPMIGENSWKPLAKINLQKKMNSSPRQLVILKGKTAQMQAQKSSLAEQSKLTDAESTDSIDDVDEEMPETRNLETKSVDNSDEVDDIVEVVPEKGFPASPKKPVERDTDTKFSTRRGEGFSRPVVTTMLDSLGSRDHMNESNSTRNEQITFSIDSDEGEPEIIEGCATKNSQRQGVEHRRPTNRDSNSETPSLDVTKDPRIEPSEKNNIMSKVSSRNLGNQESTNQQKRPKEPRTLNHVSSPHVARTPVEQEVKKTTHRNLSLETFLGHLGVMQNKGSGNEKKASKEPKNFKNISSFDMATNLDLQIKKRAQQNESLGASPGILNYRSLIKNPKHSILGGADKNSKPSFTNEKVFIDEDEVNNSLPEDSKGRTSHKQNRGQHISRDVDTSEGPSTPLSRKPVGNSKTQVQSPILKYCEEDLRENDRVSRKNKQKLRFESPSPASMKEAVGSISGKRKAYRSDLFPPRSRESPSGREELTNSIKRRKLNSEDLHFTKDPLKSALKATVASGPQNIFDLDRHLEMKPKKHRFQESPNMEVNDEISRGFYRKSPLGDKLSHRKKNSPSTSRLDHDSRPRKDALDLGNWHKELRPKSPSVPAKNGAPKGKSALGDKNHSLEATKNEQSLSNCMDQLTQLVVTGIRDRKVKIEGIAVNTRMGIFNLSNNLTKEFDQQNQEILEAVSRHGLQRQNECKEYYQQVVEHREKMNQDLEWIKKYRKECKKLADLAS